MLYEGGLCPGCGHSKSETWVEADEAAWDYIAEEVQCQTCARLESARAGKKTQKGLHYWISRRPRGTHQHEPEHVVEG